MPRSSGVSGVGKAMIAVIAITTIGLAGGIGYVLGSRNSQTTGPTADAAGPSEADGSGATAPGTTEPGDPPAARLPVPNSVPVDPESLTETQQRAAAEAEWYVNWAKDASRTEVIEWLTNETADEIFTVEDAVAGVDSIGEDWVENAKLKAQSYLDNGGFSRLGLLTQMTSSHGAGFTVHQAKTAVDSMNIDWDAEAVKYVQDKIEYTATSRGWLLYMMTETDKEDFTPEQANAAIDSLDIDWNAEAVEEAEKIRDYLPDLSCDEALEYMQDSTLLYEADQARYGLETVGVC